MTTRTKSSEFVKAAKDNDNFHSKPNHLPKWNDSVRLRTTGPLRAHHHHSRWFSYLLSGLCSIFVHHGLSHYLTAPSDIMTVVVRRRAKELHLTCSVMQFDIGIGPWCHRNNSNIQLWDSVRDNVDGSGSAPQEADLRMPLWQPQRQMRNRRRTLLSAWSAPCEGLSLSFVNEYKHKT